jgi:hypothetical protein
MVYEIALIYCIQSVFALEAEGASVFITSEHSHIKRVHHLRPSTQVRQPRPRFTGSFSTRSVKISRK